MTRVKVYNEISPEPSSRQNTVTIYSLPVYNIPMKMLYRFDHVHYNILQKIIEQTSKKKGIFVKYNFFTLHYCFTYVKVAPEFREITFSTGNPKLLPGGVPTFQGF